jgi:hypothetical protein
MAEVYWMNGFQAHCPADADIGAMVESWLSGRHIRSAWIEQVNLLYDGEATSEEILPSMLANIQAGFCFNLTQMDEHFFLQQIIRRMRVDETESQLLLSRRAGTLTCSLFMSHRLVGRSNLPPRFILGEQMAVLNAAALKIRLAEVVGQVENGLYLAGTQTEFLDEVHGDIHIERFDQSALGNILLKINKMEELHSQLGLLITRQTGQPALVTSMQGC